MPSTNYENKETPKAHEDPEGKASSALPAPDKKPKQTDTAIV
jgi:hypothetical protein